MQSILYSISLCASLIFFTSLILCDNFSSLNRNYIIAACKQITILYFYSLRLLILNRCCITLALFNIASQWQPREHLCASKAHLDIVSLSFCLYLSLSLSVSLLLWHVPMCLLSQPVCAKLIAVNEVIFHSLITNCGVADAFVLIKL